MILDHVRFSPAFLGGPKSRETWVLCILCEDDEGVTVHKLLANELRKALALPEVLKHFSSGPDGYPLSHVTAMTQRIAELQALVDKECTSGDWSPVTELFHPDMSISDIKFAVAHLLKVHALTLRAFSGNPGKSISNIRETLLQSDRLLWAGRKTQLEKDETGEPTVSEKTITNRGATAEALWQLLDDIDTLSDMIKPDDLHGYRSFFERTLGISEKRHLLLKSDGYKLTWPSGDEVERGGHPRAQVVPEPLVRTESDASWWKDRYEDLKLGVRNRLAGDHVQPMFEENAVLLARMPGKPDSKIDAKYRDLAEAVANAAHGYVWDAFPAHAALVRVVAELFDRAHAATRPPVPMLLHCPMCHTRHIDEGEFATKSHHTHSCQGYVMDEGKRRRCGHTWRPAIVPTVGVEALPGFLNERAGGNLT